MNLPVEPDGEGELLIAREGLVPEYEHRVLVHAYSDLLQGLVVAHGAEIDRTRLSGELRVELVEPEGHASVRR